MSAGERFDSVMIFCAEGAVPAGMACLVAGAAGRGSSGPAAIGRVVDVFCSGRPAGAATSLPSPGFAAPSGLIEPSSAPTPTVSPSLAAMSAMTPAAGASPWLMLLRTAGKTCSHSPEKM